MKLTALMRRVLLPVLLLVLFAAGAAAKDCESCRVIGEDEVHKLPVILANQRISMAGRVNDLFGFAQYSSIPGVVEDNAYLFAQSVDLTGEVLGDVYAFCQTLSVTGEVGGDVYAWAGELLVEPGAVLRGNILSGAGIVQVEGRVEGYVKVNAGEVIIDGELLQGVEIEAGRIFIEKGARLHGGLRADAGEVNIHGELDGDVDIDTGQLSIGPTAKIHGDLVYSASQEAEVDPAAQIDGELVFYERIVPMEEEEGEVAEERSGLGAFFGVLRFLWVFLGAFILGAVILAVMGKQARRPSEVLNRQPGRTLGVGFVVFVVMPVASIVAMLLILPLPLGLVTLMIYAVALPLAGLVVALCLGGRLLGLLGRPAACDYLALALGLLVLGLLGLIPYLGFLIKVVTLVAGLGGIFLVLVGRNSKPVPEAV